MHSVLNEKSFLEELESIARDTMDSAKKQREKNKSTYMYGSVSKYTQKLVLSFPTIADNTVSLSTAQLISKAHEKNLVSMFEMLFTSMSLSGTNGIEILQSLHQNLNDNTSIDDIIDAIEKAVGESGNIPFTNAEIRSILNEMCDYLKYRQKTLPVDSFSEKSLNDYIVRESYSGTVVMEAPQPKTHTQKDVDDALERGKKDEEQGYAGNRDRRAEEEREENKERYEREKRSWESDDPKDANQTEERRRKEDRDQRKAEREADRKQRDFENEVRLAQSRVKDVDYKKANELQPTLMTVIYHVTDKDDKFTGDKKVFTAGIKSRLVGSDAMEIVERLSGTVKNKLTFKDLIRATTGEISLVKDFIAATKQAKINAKNAAKRGETAKMWNLLSARAKKNKVTGTGMKSNEAACITTLIINQETVNYLANQYKINIDSPKVASEIMNSFNLLAIVIADEANEVAKFLYDGNNSFELVAYSSLSRDQRDDKNYNKAINLINKSGR